MQQLRPATIDDAAWLYRWRNDPEVRSVAFDNAPIPWADHESWLQQHLGDPRHQILISENTYGAPIGSVQVSLDRSNNEAMVNAIVDQHKRGRSLGSVLINAAVDYLFSTTPTRRVIAKLRAGNTAGERSFRLAGFTAIAPTIVRNVMASQFELVRQAGADLGSIHRAA
jgi:RimJ/RimL family protein N-acetyltransferase